MKNVIKKNKFSELSYWQSFENNRRLRPYIWNADFCLLKGLSNVIGNFSAKFAVDNQIIVDFGCGAKPYRSLFPEMCNYIGIDIGENPFADILIESDGISPLEDGIADLVVSTQVIYLVKDYSKYLEECRRLLKPTGRLFISTHGTWTHHPASGGDYYRFTHDGLCTILNSAGFEIQEMHPIVGTLGTGLHLRQLVFNHWLKKIGLNWIANSYNIFTNLRILFEEKIQPYGTRMSSPVIYAAFATVKK